MKASRSACICLPVVKNVIGSKVLLHPLGEGLQWYEQHARVGCIGEGCAIEAGECHGMRDTRSRQEDF